MMANIGEEQEPVRFEPFPAEEPIKEPAPVQPAKEPVPAGQ